MDRAAFVDVSQNRRSRRHPLLEFKRETRERGLGDTQSAEALERERNTHPRVPSRVDRICRGCDDGNQPPQQCAPNTAVSDTQQEVGADVRGRPRMQHPTLDVVQLQGARSVNHHVSVA